MQRRLILLGGAHAHTPDHLAAADTCGWRFVGVHDRDAARASELAERLGARRLEDWSAADLPAADAAIVCSETSWHEADIAAALDEGLPVLSEKPLAASTASARSVTERAQARALPLVTNYFLRTYPALQHLARLIREDALGRILSARLRFSHDGAYADWLDLDSWMTDPDLAIYGGFADEAVHVLDLALWFFGALDPAGLVVDTAGRCAVDTHGTALFRTREGAPVTVEAGWTDAEMRLELDIVGSAGHAALGAGWLDIMRRDRPDEVTRHRLGTLDAGAGARATFAALGRGETVPDGFFISGAEGVAVNALLEDLFGR
jgi:predicted dehydrogenase